MKLATLIGPLPPEIPREQFLRGYIKGLWEQHLQNLKTAADREHPLREDALEWLTETSELCREILEQDITTGNHVIDNFVTLLARLDPQREVIINRKTSHQLDTAYQ
jgi:hypothetical protein